jgi:Family of unknown function (DUF6580)
MKIPSRFVPIAIMVLVPALFRLIPYILAALGFGDVHDVSAFRWNFSPVSALFLFGGAKLADRRSAYLVPLAAMLLSDLGIAALMGDLSMGLHAMIPVVYGSYAVMVWLGTLLRQSRNPLAIAGAALVGEIFFFVTTNFANWVVQTGTYPHTIGGLTACYLAGLAFFQYSLISMGLYGSLLFGGFALVERKFGGAKAAPALVPNSNQPSGA